MKKIIIIALVYLGISSCELIKSDETKAIEVCQKAKVQFETDNKVAELIDNLFSNSVAKNVASTWLDYANLKAQKDATITYEWKSEETSEEGIFLVAFTNLNGWGYRWEVALEQKIVKYINGNEYLSRKHGLSGVKSRAGFALSNIKLDTLSLKKRYRYSDPKIVYQMKASIFNNTGKTIVKAQIDGTLKVIFENKVIEGESTYTSGFVSTVSKSRPWKNGEERKFRLITEGIEQIYADYQPPYVLFEVGLNAKDPVGYEFNANIIEKDLSSVWQALKSN